jgi:hypothetical protein
LQESGVVSISNLARQFQLAGELVLSIITPRMGTLVQGRLESGLIFTPAYIARIKAQVCLPAISRRSSCTGPLQFFALTCAAAQHRATWLTRRP